MDVSNKEKAPYDILHSFSLFDSEWYKEQYGRSKEQVEHYLSEGWKSGYNFA